MNWTRQFGQLKLDGHGLNMVAHPAESGRSLMKMEDLSDWKWTVKYPIWWNLTKKSFKCGRSFKRDGSKRLKMDGFSKIYKNAQNGTVCTDENWLNLICARTVHFHSWRPSSFEPSWSNLNFRCKNGFFTSQPKISGFKFELTVPLYLYRHNISIYETFYWYSH